MTIWRTTSQTLTAILLILLMSMVNVAPAGRHLSFCFGQDSHFEVSAVSCAMAQQIQQAVLSNQPHHGTCLDVHLPCNGQKQLAASDVKLVCSDAAKKKNSSSPPAFCAGASSWSIHSPPVTQHNAFPTIPPLQPFHLTFLQTVVLVI
jgi:hypothetical protein